MQPVLLLALGMTLSFGLDTTLPTLPTTTESPACAAGLEPAAAVICLNQAALEMERRGDLAGASKALEQAGQLWAGEPRPPAALRATVLTNLGETYEELGRWRESRQCFQDAMSIYETAFGRSDVRTASAMVRLATMEMMLGNTARAEELLGSALPVERNAMPGSARELAAALSFTAMFKLQQGDAPAAEDLAQEGVAASGSESKESPEYAASLTTLAGVYIVEHDLTRATPLLNRAIDILERRLGTDHPRLAPVLMDRAMIYQGENKTSLAEADAERAVAILIRESGHDSISAIWAKTRLSGIYLDEGKTVEADAILPGAVERQRRFYDKPNWRVAASIGELGRLRAAQARGDEAVTLYRESLAMFESVAPNNPEAARTMRRYAELLKSQGGSKREIRRLTVRANSILSAGNTLLAR